MAQKEIGEWTTEELFHSGFGYFEELLQTIKKAQKSILLEVYIFANDPTGQAIAKALVSAAHRGVRIKVMIDGIGSPDWERTFGRLLRQAGIETHLYHPLPWQARRWIQAKERSLGLWLRLFGRLNSRNHRKVWVIDQEIAFVGSMNVSAPNQWRDTGVKVTGPGVYLLYEAFQKAWYRRRRKLFGLKEKTVAWSKLPVRLNNTHRRRRFLYRDFLRRILSAQKRVWIANAYFVPDGTLIHALRVAAWAGVDVRLMLPHRSDVVFVRWVSTLYYFSLLKAGVRVFEYLPPTLHAKTALLDNWALVGSSNLNHRSLIHDLEVDIVLSHKSSIQDLALQYQEDCLYSQEITLENWKGEPWWTVLLGKLIYLVMRSWI